MSAESWRRKLDRGLRVGSVASIALAPYSSISPQKDGQKLSESSAHVLNLESSLLHKPLTFESNGARVIFGSTEKEQQAEQTSSRTIGLLAGFNKEGSVVLTGLEGVRREIVLPRVERFAIGGMSVSPDGTRIAVWREKSDGWGFEVFLASVFGDVVSPLAPEVINNLDAYDRFGTSLKWSPDGRKLAVISGQHGGGKTAVFDPENGQKIFERRGSQFSQFSPDGNWFAKTLNRDIEVIGMDGQGIRIRNGGGLFSWSPDSKFIAFQDCIMWSPGAWGDQCMYSNLSVFELETQRARAFGQSEPYFKPVFSPDGKKIVFRKPSNTRIASLSVLDLEKGETKSINLPSEEFSLNQNWTVSFRNNGEALIWGQRNSDNRLQLLLVDIRNTRLLQQYWVSYTGIVFFLQAFQNKFIYGSEDIIEEKRTYFSADLSPRDGALTPVRLVDSPNSAGWLAKSTEIFGTVREGELIRSSNEFFLYLNGRARRIIHEETKQFFENQRGDLPPGLAPFVPEGEKIEFLPGDVVGHNEIGIWYLRNGKRYRVQNWDWFKSRQKFDRGEWPVAKELIERVPLGEVPPPEPGTNGIRDWDGKIKERQPFGGRMAIFMGGYGSTSDSQIQTFRLTRDLLTWRSWFDTRHLEMTYNVLETSDRGNFPLGHISEHTRRHPLESVRKVELQIQRYKEKFPLTKFILVGHSWGGFVLFNAAVRHADAIEAVITIDSPLTGIDKTFQQLDRITQSPDWFLTHYEEFRNSEVGSYLIEKGDDPNYAREVEAKAWHLISRGVKVITSTNEDDIFIPSWNAVLGNSRTQAAQLGIQLVWRLGHTSWNDIPTEWSALLASLFELIGGHGQMLRDEGVWRSWEEVLFEE